MVEEMRRTGIDVIGNAPWGTHLCQFYQSKWDLIDILVPYFRQGLADNEFCMWVTSEPLGVDEASAALKCAVPALDDYLRKGQIEILDYTQWYTRTGRFNAEDVLTGWVEKLEGALARGYEGLRLTGNTFWLEQKDWADFTAYEEAVNRAIGKYRMLAVCTYSLHKCGAPEIMDVVSNHRFALVKRAGQWQMIESAEHQRTKAVLSDSEHRLQLAKNATRLGIHDYDIPSGIITWDERVRELWGVGSDEPITYDLFMSSLHPDDRAETQSAVDRALDPTGDGLYRAEYRVINRTDGVTRWIAANGQVFFEGGRAVRLVGTVQDITDRKRAEEDLRQARDELERRVAERTAELADANERLRRQIVERVRAWQSLTLERARLDALVRLSRLTDASVAEVSRFILEQGIALTRSKIGFVGFLNEDESVYTLEAVSKDVVKECRVTGNPMRWSVADAGIWAEAIRERRTLFVNDYDEFHPAKKGLPPGHLPIKRCMVVPFFEEKKIVAVAGVGNKDSDYDPSDERQVALLLGGLWQYMQRERSKAALQQAHDELEQKVQQRTAELVAANATLEREIAERIRTEKALRVSQHDLDRAQSVGQIGSWRLDVRLNVLTWSDENYHIFGVPAGTPLTYETFLGFVHPDDRRYVDTQWKMGVNGEPYDIEHRIVVDGHVKWVREKAYLEFDEAGRLLGGFGITQDVTERKRAEEALQRLNETLEQRVTERTAMLELLSGVATAANDAQSVEEAFEYTLKRVSEHSGWRFGHAYLLEDGDSHVLAPVRAHYDSAPERFQRFRAATFSTPLWPGQGLPGRAYESKSVQWMQDVDEELVARRADLARELGIRCGAAFPIFAGDDVVGVLEFFSDKQVERTDGLLELMANIGTQLGRVVERQRFEKRLARALLAEQQRVGQDLHDTVGQELAGLALIAERMAQQASAGAPPDAAALTPLGDGLRDALNDMRAVVRDMLPPEAAYPEALVPALEELAASVAQRYNVACEVDCPQPISVDVPEVAMSLYRIAAEAVTNAASHAQARRIGLCLTIEDDRLLLEVRDDGVGIPKDAEARGSGLRIMRHRAKVIGGTLNIRRGPRGGTVVACVLPIERLRLAGPATDLPAAP